MNDFDKYLDEHGVGLAIGLIGGIALVVILVLAIAFSDRRPPDA